MKRYFAIIPIFILLFSTSGGVVHTIPPSVQNNSIAFIDSPNPNEALYVSHYPIVIAHELDFENEASSGTGTEEDPYILENLNITGSGISCISIAGVDVHFIIRNCYLNGFIGILLDGVENALIDNCIIIAYETGIDLRYTENINITNTVLYGGNLGLNTGSARNFRFSNNTVYNNVIGIRLSSYTNGPHPIFTDNKIFGNVRKGFDLTDNTANNTFYGNIIGWNGGGLYSVINADDDGSNHWNFTSIGNAWHDYTGLGLYYVGGSGSNIDYHATQLVDDEPPAISQPDDIQFQQGSLGHDIHWEVEELYPDTYSITVRNLDDPSIVVPFEFDWDGSDITYNPDSLSPARYEIQMTAVDCAGNLDSDTVLVDIIGSDAIILGLPQMILGAVAVGSVIVVYIVLKRR